MATYSSRQVIYKNSGIKILPLAWNSPQKPKNEHPYGAIIFDDAKIDTNYIFKNLFALIAGEEPVERSPGRAINCVYINPIVELCYIHRCKRINSKTTIAEKISHVQTMLQDLAATSEIPFSTVLLKNWYANETIMALVMQMKKFYWCPLRANSVVREDRDNCAYVAVKDMIFTTAELVHGKLIFLKSFPKDRIVKLFRITKKNGHLTHVVTNQIKTDSVEAELLMGEAHWKTEHDDK